MTLPAEVEPRRRLLHLRTGALELAGRSILGPSFQAGTARGTRPPSREEYPMNSRTVDILNAGPARPNTPVALRRAVVPVTGVALLLAALLGAGQPGTPTPTAVNVASQSSVGP